MADQPIRKISGSVTLQVEISLSELLVEGMDNTLGHVFARMHEQAKTVLESFALSCSEYARYHECCAQLNAMFRIESDREEHKSWAVPTEAFNQETATNVLDKLLTLAKAMVGETLLARWMDDPILRGPKWYACLVKSGIRHAETPPSNLST